MITFRLISFMFVQFRLIKKYYIELSTSQVSSGLSCAGGSGARLNRRDWCAGGSRERLSRRDWCAGGSIERCSRRDWCAGGIENVLAGETGVLGEYRTL